MNHSEEVRLSEVASNGDFQLAVIIRVEYCKRKLLQMKVVIRLKPLQMIMIRRYFQLLLTEMKK